MFLPIKVHSANIQQYHNLIRGHHHSFPITMDKGRIMRGEMARITSQMSEVCSEGIHHSHLGPSTPIVKRKGMWWLIVGTWRILTQVLQDRQWWWYELSHLQSLRFQVILQSWTGLLMSTHLSFPKKLYRTWAQVSQFQSPFCGTLEQISPRPYC